MSRYFDSSALVKFLIAESESQALRARVDADTLAPVTSVIAITEVGITASRRNGAIDVEQVIAHDTWLMVPWRPVLALPLEPPLTRWAARLGAAYGLRTLDAIHVATAAALRPGLAEVVTYDRRMATVCARLGIPAVAPGASADRQS